MYEIAIPTKSEETIVEAISTVPIRIEWMCIESSSGVISGWPLEWVY